MSLAASLLPEFDQEMATTRRYLERLPADHLDFRPHERNSTLQKLATHLAYLPTWVAVTVDRDHIDLASPEAQMSHEPLKSAADAVARFDAHVAEARARLSGADDARLLGPWSLQQGGAVVLTLPRIACLRSFVMNHLVHHRAQLGVYYRMCGVPVPATYGPSADEPGM